jgi:hypothetical protein
MTVSNGSTGRPGSGQAPTDSTTRGQNNGAANGRGNGRDELTVTRASGGGRGTASGPYAASGGARPGPTGRSQPPADPRTQPSTGARPAPVTSWAPKGRRPAPTGQPGNPRPTAAVPTSSPTGPQAHSRPGTQPAAQPGSPQRNDASRPRPEESVPVWDPPPPRAPRLSLRERLGLGKKPQSEGDAASKRPTSPTAKTQSGSGGSGARPGGATAPRAPLAGAAGAGAAAATGAAAPAALTPPPPAVAPPRTSRDMRAAGPTAQPTTTNRGTTPGAGVPSAGSPGAGAAVAGAAVAGGPTAAQLATGGATTVGGGSAPPLYRTPPPLTTPPPLNTPTDRTPLVAPGGPGVDPAGAVPGSTPSGAGSTAVSPEALAAAKPKAGTPRRTRKARLRLSRLDPWSVMKTSFLFSIAAGIMLVVATYAVWTVLSQSGLFPAINDIVASVVSTPGDTTPFRIEEYINTQKVLGVAALIACVDVVIFTALATLGSFLYNLAATVLGGLEITLAED